MNEKPKKVLAIFDQKDSDVVDHLTVVLDFVELDGYYDMLAMGDDVTSPQGFFQSTSGQYSPKAKNKHLGTKINWEDLDDAHQKAVISYFSED